MKKRYAIAKPIKKSQPVKGSKITSKIPIPKPIKQTAKVFLNR